MMRIWKWNHPLRAHSGDLIIYIIAFEGGGYLYIHGDGRMEAFEGQHTREMSDSWDRLL